MATLVDNITKYESDIEKILHKDRIEKKLTDFYALHRSKKTLDLVIEKLFSIQTNKITPVSKSLVKLLHITENTLSKYSDENLQIDGNCFKEKIIIAQSVLTSVKTNKEIGPDLYEKLTYKQKIKSFSLLSEDWDSYGAIKIDKEAIRQSVNFITTYSQYEVYLKFVYPTIDGSVGLEYENKNRIGFNIKNKFDVKMYRFDNHDYDNLSIDDFFNFI